MSSIFFFKKKKVLLSKVFPKIKFIQDNESQSEFGVLRGLHFQIPPFSQTKLLRVVKGKVLDVAVDLRKNSKTFGKHVTLIMSDKDDFSFYIPEGFAHGFLCLSKVCSVNYKCSRYWEPTSEKTLRWNDPIINIKWLIKNPILSDKDKNLGLSLNEFL